MDYARTLVEHPKWAWHIGMVAERGARAATQGIWVGRPVYDIGKGFAGYEVPDINHPATKGWLLHMLREATGTQDACATWLGGEWRLYGWIGASALGRFATEGDALAAALLAVWGPA